MFKELSPIFFCIYECARFGMSMKRNSHVLGDQEVTANLYCHFAYPYWEGCVICSIHLR